MPEPPAPHPAPGPGTQPDLRWSRASLALLSSFLAAIGLILYIWWPLVADYARTFNPDLPLWRQVDWLLLGIFAFMSVLITLGADLRRDVLLAAAGFAGGFVIESWGTHSGLWAYYTGEKPPLWILPAWPVAALAIERMVRLVPLGSDGPPHGRRSYAAVMAVFFALMLAFVRPTLGNPLTALALLGVAAVMLTSPDPAYDLATFACGTALGYFLERWGTTRECWVYYTRQTPPLFAVLAHGLASVAFWRVSWAARRIIAFTRQGTASGRREPA